MKHPLPKKQKAFTLVELLMSLMILGFLMAAVAVAFDASITNYQVNEGIYRAVNTGRQTLLRITNDVRTAQSVKIFGPGGDTSLSNLSLTTANGEEIRYRFDLPTKTLYLDNITSGSSGNILCKNVTAMIFNRTVVSGSSPAAIRNVRIVMTLEDDTNTSISQTLAAAAVVRRNL